MAPRTEQNGETLQHHVYGHVPMAPAAGSQDRARRVPHLPPPIFFPTIDARGADAAGHSGARGSRIRLAIRAHEPAGSRFTGADDGRRRRSGLLETGRRFARDKDWARAESAYRSALAAEPHNREAVVGLSDVLYEEHKYEESAAELNRLSESAK